MSEVLFAWPVSSYFGWGLRGLGMVLNWPGVARSLMELDAELSPGDPRAGLLSQRFDQSRELQIRIPAQSFRFTDTPVFIPLGNDLRKGPVVGGRWVTGSPTIACPVFEDVKSVKQNIDNLKEYDGVVVASRWNQEVLEDLGVRSKLVHEGVDPAIFNPSVRKPRDDGKFRVFSGGKAEWRKGQDLVLKAFRIFAEQHDDALLVAAWGSPWGRSAADFEGKWELGSPPGIHIGMPNYVAWAQKAGIKPHQFELVPVMPNWRMAEVYGSVDCAVFPNRCEGGTNFVAMECMACGVPTILRPGFGHSDLRSGWWKLPAHEDDVVENAVAALEAAYSGTGPVAPLNGYWTWERHCRELAEIAACA